MRKMFLITAVCILLLITGCGKETDFSLNTKTEYTYNAHCEGYDLIFTPTILTVTDSSGIITEPVYVDIPARIVQFENLKINADELFTEYSIFTLGELLYKILSNTLQSQANTENNELILSGTYIKPYILSLDKKTATPLKLEYNGKTVYFES